MTSPFFLDFKFYIKIAYKIYTIKLLIFLEEIKKKLHLKKKSYRNKIS